ncbi:MAG: alpha-amylase family glycosyl hydrolase [Bacteroidota bacterium]
MRILPVRIGPTLYLPYFSLLTLVFLGSAFSQTVDIKFRYQPQGEYVRVHFPGEFNNWGPNSSGTIGPGTPSEADSLELSTGLWLKTVSLAFGTWKYKVYRQLTTTPTDWSWIPDPLNRVVVDTEQNSQFGVDSLVLFQLCAYPYQIESGSGSGGFVVRRGLPNLSAGIFQPAGAPPASIQAFVDTVSIPNAESYRDTTTGIFTYVPPAALADGFHTFKLVIAAGTQTRTDSVIFEVRAQPVQIETPPYVTRKTSYVTAGLVFKSDRSGPDSSVTSAAISVNGDSRSIPVLNGRFADTTSIQEGENRIRVSTATGADSVLVTCIVNRSPNARARAFPSGANVLLTAAISTDPDSQQIASYVWLDDPLVPLGLDGQTGVDVVVAKPDTAGEYYFGLIVEDPDGNADTTRSYFIIHPDGSLENPTIASNPAWAKQARVYFLFPKAASSAGTINAAALRIPEIKRLGFSVIWMMPVMDNAFTIDNGQSSGYNIVDFYNVAPEYGTNQDFKNFVDQAHAHGLKVIQDVTPNHSGRFHAWASSGRTLGSFSPYWSWYEHSIIPHSDNDLFQSLDAFGYNYYTGFSDQLLNLDWTDIDAQAEMIRVYKYWIQEFGLDGYRFDVYWGPERRYGTQYMGMPVREALKHIKPDILLLGEDTGTGSGSEFIYADWQSGGLRGGLDAAYDFKLFWNGVRNFGFDPTAISVLHANIENNGFYPGPNSFYLRYMETQDEDRIYNIDPAPSTYYDANPETAFRRTMPMASVLFTAPGLPMIWNGQEVGWGYGIPGNKLNRSRSVIDWNFEGKTLLQPHYQRMASIRGQFGAFTKLKQDTNADSFVNSADLPDIVRIGSGNGLLYSFTRPYEDRNGLTLVNFSGSAQSGILDLTVENALLFAAGIQEDSLYYLNNLYDNTYQRVPGSGLDSVSIDLPPYGSAIFTVSLTRDTVAITNPIVDVRDPDLVPTEFALDQNYPNPFNPTTTIRFSLPQAVPVRLAIYDLLGRHVTTLIDGHREAGNHTVVWNGVNDSGVQMGTGVYFYRLTADMPGGPGSVLVRKMLLLK